MSNNLVKQMYMVLPQDERRVIDNNERMKSRLEEYEIRRRLSGSEGFVSGLMADSVEVLEDEAVAEARIVKAREDAEVVLEVAQRKAQEMIDGARAQAAQLIAQAVNEAAGEKEKIFEEARVQGYNEGEAKALAMASELEKEYQAKANALEQEYQQQVAVLEPRFVDVITDIYQQIFHVELDGYRDILAHLIMTTMRKLEGGREFMIHVSKEDYPYVSMQKKQFVAGVAANCNVDVVEDATLSRNECMIETESGIYDCGLGTQMEELKRKLMLLAWSKED